MDVLENLLDQTVVFFGNRMTDRSLCVKDAGENQDELKRRRFCWIS